MEWSSERIAMEKNLIGLVSFLMSYKMIIVGVLIIKYSNSLLQAFMLEI